MPDDHDLARHIAGKTVGFQLGFQQPGTAYFFLAIGGNRPYRWQFNSPPDGLSVKGLDSDNPYFFGTPTTAGTFPINVTVTDSTPSPPGPCTASKSYTLTIKPEAGAPHFVVTKSVDPKLPDLASDGSFQVTYTLTITNDGSAPGTATVEDTVSGPKRDISNLTAGCTTAPLSPITCTSGMITQGASQSFSFNVKYIPPHLRSYPNNATVTTNQTGAKSESNVTKIKLAGIPERFLVPENPAPPPATNKGRKR